MAGLSGPHFVRIPDGYAHLPVQLAVVGQQTRGWDWAPEAVAQVDLYRAKALHPRPRSSFWQAVRHVAKVVDGRADAPLLWTNLIAADVNKKRPPPAVRDALRRAVPSPGGECAGDGLLGHVLHHARPHAAVFFTGSTGYYRYELRQQFPGVEAEPVDGFGDTVVERLRHDRLPGVTFLTEHPRTLKRRGAWEVVRSIPGLILDGLDRG